MMMPSAVKLAAGTLWAGCSVLLALFISGDAFMLAAGLLGALGLWVGATYAWRGLVMLWLVGTPSLFVLVNAIIRARGIPVITVERSLLAFLVGVLVLHLVLERIRLPRLHIIDKWMLALLGIVLLSMLARSHLSSMQHFSQSLVLYAEAYVMPFAMYAVARATRWADEDLARLFRLAMVLALYLLAVGAAQYFAGVLFFAPTYRVVDTTGRATGGFGSPLEYGMVMSMLALLALIVRPQLTRLSARWAVLVLSMLAAVGTALCLTRAQWLAFAAALAFLFWKDRENRVVLSSAAAIAFVCLIVALPWLVDSRLFHYRILDVSPVLNRFALWLTALNMITHNPVFGVGFGFRAFHEAKFDYLTSIGPAALGQYALDPGVPHNEFLHVLALTGLTGFVPYLLVWLWVVRIASAVAARPDIVGVWRACLGRFLQCAVIVYVVSGMFAETFYFVYFLSVVFFCTGLLVPAYESLPAARGMRNKVPAQRREAMNAS